MRRPITMILAALMCTPATIPYAVAQDVDQIPRGYIDLLRVDIKSKKREIITQVVPVSREQEAKFWTMYRSFEAELDKITDDRVQLIGDFSKSWDNMSDAQARDQARRAPDLSERRAKLNRKYYLQFETAFSPLLAAKLFQIEGQLQTVLDYQRVSALPLIK